MSAQIGDKLWLVSTERPRDPVRECEIVARGHLHGRDDGLIARVTPAMSIRLEESNTIGPHIFVGLLSRHLGYPLTSSEEWPLAVFVLSVDYRGNELEYDDKGLSRCIDWAMVYKACPES